jgi:hypothetical protein
MRRAASIEDLARQTGLAATALRETVHRFNTHADRGGIPT